jgi:hypothetical protein
MGWTITTISRRTDLIAERRAPNTWTAADGGVFLDVILKSCYKGSAWKGTWYAVHERTKTLNGVVETERWIEVTLMQYYKPEGWGYKDMEESCGPNESKCPISYLDMVPEAKCLPDNEACRSGDCSHKWAQDWRLRCRANAERIRKRRMELPVDQGRYKLGALRRAMNRAGLKTQDCRHGVRVVVFEHPNPSEAREMECVERSMAINWNDDKGYVWYAGGLRSPYEGRSESQDIQTVVETFKQYVEDGKLVTA